MSSEVGDVHARPRAHTKSLDALRRTRVEQGRELREGFAEVDQRFAELRVEMRDATLRTELRDGFAEVGAGMAQITALLKIAMDESEQPDES